MRRASLQTPHASFPLPPRPRHTARPSACSGDRWYPPRSSPRAAAEPVAAQTGYVRLPAPWLERLVPGLRASVTAPGPASSLGWKTKQPRPLRPDGKQRSSLDSTFFLQHVLHNLDLGPLRIVRICREIEN